MLLESFLLSVCLNIECKYRAHEIAKEQQPTVTVGVVFNRRFSRMLGEARPAWLLSSDKMKECGEPCRGIVGVVVIKKF